MIKNPEKAKAPAEQVEKNIWRAARKLRSSEVNIWIVLSGLRRKDGAWSRTGSSGHATIAELCRKDGSAQGLCYNWSKVILEDGKRRLAGDTARQANTVEL
jgi:transposase